MSNAWNFTVFNIFLLIGMVSCQSEMATEEGSNSDSSIAVSIGAQLSSTQSTYLRPADEAVTDEALVLARDSLIFYLKQVDTVALKRFFTSSFKWKRPDSTLSLRSTQTYLAADSTTAKRWAQLLTRGGAFETKKRERFKAPYWRADFPQTEAKTQLGFVDGENVSFRTAPNINAPLINRLNYEVVEQRPLEAEKLVYETHNDVYAAWLLVRVLETEKEGYLFGAFYQPIQTDALWFEKEEGKWRLALVQSPAG